MKSIMATITADEIKALVAAGDYRALGVAADTFLKHNRQLYESEEAWAQIGPQQKAAVDELLLGLKLAATALIETGGEVDGLMRITKQFELLGLIQKGKEFVTRREEIGYFERPETDWDTGVTVVSAYGLRNRLYLTTGKLSKKPDSLHMICDSLYVGFKPEGRLKQNPKRPWTYGISDEQARQQFFDAAVHYHDDRARNKKAGKKLEGMIWRGFEEHEACRKRDARHHPADDRQHFLLLNEVYDRDLSRRRTPVFFESSQNPISYDSNMGFEVQVRMAVSHIARMVYDALAK